MTTNAHKRQFAPEYSNTTYLAMINKEYAIGNYLSAPNCSLDMSNCHRRNWVILIEHLHLIKQYKLETLYLAVSIADRYLSKLAKTGKPSPCSETLAVTSILVAAKVEEPISPSVNIMRSLLEEFFDITLEKQNMLDMERQILLVLEFSVHHVSPISLMERYLRIFDIDEGGSN